MLSIKSLASDSEIETYLRGNLVLSTTLIRKKKNLPLEEIQEDVSDVEEDDLENGLIYPEEIVSTNNRNNNAILLTSLMFFNVI